jgi:acetylornithine deacetylase
MSPLQRTIEYLKELIAFPSVSSTSNREISDWVSERLQAIGFQVEQTSYLDEQRIEKVNVVGRRDPESNAAPDRGGFAYFAHTDVVPAIGWTGPGGEPFQPYLTDTRIYGRGSCDMKGSLAAMLAAAHEFTAAQQQSPLWIVCTADEEVGFAGVKHLVQHSSAYRDLVRHQPLSVIGEPTQLNVVHAHKGIVGLRVTSRGRAAHSSTSTGINANRKMVPMLQLLLEINELTTHDARYLDHRFDPPTLSWNFGVSDRSTAINITPELSVAWVSLRPMPQIDGKDLMDRVQQRASELGLEFQRFDGGAPLWIDADSACIREFARITASQPRTVCYGTDGGELTELENRVVFGPGDIAQAHTTDEWIELDQLQRGTQLLHQAARHFLTRQ